MTPSIGTPLDRVDGRQKVTGTARYAGDWDLTGLAHGVLVTSPVGPGRLTSLNISAAASAPGVLAIVTHRNAHSPHAKPSQFTPHRTDHTYSPDTLTVLWDAEIHYAGQPVAVVVAETLEQATEAAALIRLEVEARAPRLDLAAHLNEAYPPDQIFGEDPDTKRGDFEAGWHAANTRIDATYTIPWEHHNPIEPHTTIASWEGNHLTVHDATQWVYGVRAVLARTLDLKPEQVRVVSPFVGGAFGCKGMTWPHVVCAALAARAVGRPVKLAVTRAQMFGLIGFRPTLHQRVRLGATKDGRLTAIGHDGTNGVSALGTFVEPVGQTTRMLYSCPNVWVRHRVVDLDTQMPTYMRAPGEATGSFALESAMDELAYALGMDPLALRLANYAERDEVRDLPWSSKELRACYQQGAERFGWAQRDPRPGSMRDGHLQVGWGMATATYPTYRSQAAARVRIDEDGRALVQSAAHDLGTGAYTVLTQVAADMLGLPPDRVRFELGDSDLPEAPVAGGSQTTASVSAAVAFASKAALDQLRDLARRDPASPLHEADPNKLVASAGHLVHTDSPERREAFGDLLRRNGLPAVVAERRSVPGDEENRWSSHAFGAQFAEVKVDPDLGTVRVTRFVGAFAAGRILNPKTARSQMLGGITMGIGLALMEEGVRDPRWGRVMNADLASYLIPVHLDIPHIEAFFVPEEDPYVNPLGVKGVGELGIVGAGAAIANAVFHATGKRIRDLPITVEKLL
ncbi:xanthine dehydrogenase family protein molybdopterin-binding subunit [bacterium]|nr:xanthine dehydrogenase family protein molybdopterin-binding subunit [bacterium]